MTTQTALRQPETSDERITAIETHLPYLATREDVVTSRKCIECAMREHSDKFHDAMRQHSERFYDAMREHSDNFHVALREQSAGFYSALMKQSADAQAQARSDRRWIIGTIITVGLAIAALVVGVAG